jgi:hypothetical protein
MAIFCTKCGTHNEDGAAFCDNCGGALRKPVVVASAPVPAVSIPSTPSISPKKALIAGAALCAVLAVAGGVVYFVNQPPAATPSALLAAAKAGFGDAFDKKYQSTLCIGNMDYAASPFNAAQGDTSTRTWLDALVKAGLYSPAVEIPAADFQQALAQYQPTPELAKWRKGRSLCAAHHVGIAEVSDIQKPAEGSITGGADSPKVLAVKASFVLQTTDTAPWMSTAEVRDAVLPQLQGWTYQDAHLQRVEPNSFGLREGKWATGMAYVAELEQQVKAARRGQKADGSTAAASPGLFSGIGASLSNLFSFGGHPLKGTWRMDAEAMGESMGVGKGMGSVLGNQMDMTFTSTSMEVGGQSIKATFEVDGKRVKVMPEGQPGGLIFVMIDSDTAKVDMGLMSVQYKRVK